jgi:diaminopimelate epimerase
MREREMRLYGFIHPRIYFINFFEIQHSTMIQFSKYQGTGNDFILIDDQEEVLKKELADPEWVARLCHRRFGIGADGLIALRRAEGYDFEMLYFNADGHPGSMCGNGGRCAVAFSHQMGIEKTDYYFLAVDGPHEARRLEDGRVALKMSNVGEVEAGDGYYLLDTGSPHYVVFVEDVSDINIVETGQAIRYSERFREKGVNVNFVERREGGSIEVATYERGVEDETLLLRNGRDGLLAGAGSEEIRSGA